MQENVERKMWLSKDFVCCINVLNLKKAQLNAIYDVNC